MHKSEVQTVEAASAEVLPPSGPVSPLEARFDLDGGDVHLSGLQTLVRLPLDQRRLDQRRGLDTGLFISGYEGSPLAGLDLQLSRQRERLEQHHVVFKPSVNEELAATAVQGSQLASASPDLVGDGVVGIWYGKAPGLDRASDALRHSNLSGTDRRGGVLALVGDDATAKSSTVPSSSEPAIAELGMPCLSPSDPQDILDLGLHGIAMSRACGLWVALKLATNVVDGSGTVSLDSNRVDPIEPDRLFGGQTFTHEVTGKLLQPTLSELERSQGQERVELARRYAAINNLDRIVGDPSGRIGIICAGATYRDVRQALGDMGIDEENISTSGMRVLKLAMINPLETGIITSFADGLTEIIVVEEKKAFLELAVKDLLYGRPNAPMVYGKRDEHGNELFRRDSDLPADYIAARLAPRIRDNGGPPSVSQWLDSQTSKRRVPTLLPLLARTPYLCSGCPHNSSTKVPAGSLVGAGIGCHGLIALLPEDRVGTSIGLSAMGGEGAAWIGMSPFVRTNHLFQNLGDGTFHHSGSLAVRAAAASDVNITYKLLYNDTVAMTGGQDAVGKMGVPEVTVELLAEGVQQVVITSDDPKSSRKAFGRGLLAKGVSIRHRDDLIAVQEELAKVPGVTVLIHQQECATELRRKRKRGLVSTPKQRIMINERVCEGCGDCGDKSSCLSVQPVDTEFGRKTRIHQASCNLDFSCVKGDCPSFIEVVPGTKSASTTSKNRNGSTIDAASLPTPTPLVGREDFTMRITGVGGTGVVTVSQVLAAAASHAGLQVAGLDQLGLAQKGGAVVSDVRFSTAGIVGSNKVGPGECDLYLGCDVLVAAAQHNLAVMGPGRTYAVVSTSETATGEMVTDTRKAFPERDELVQRIEWAGPRVENVFVDARQEVSAALEDDQYANVYLLGVAVQAGVLPLSPEDVEWALDLNGVQVARNQQAFRLGRHYVVTRGADQALGSVDKRPAGPARNVAAVAQLVDSPPGSVLADLVARRVEELIAYQDVAYARRYAQEVEAVRAVAALALGTTEELTLEYARQLFKLMAYKDEYEVARLYVDPAFGAEVQRSFGDGARYSILLHPPLLRAIGLKQKIRLKSWAVLPVMRLLYVMRRLRGTRLDLFGYANVRKTERSLIIEYIESVRTAVDTMTPDTAGLVQELTTLPSWVRGYEEVKMRSVEEYRERRGELLGQLATPLRTTRSSTTTQ